MRWRLRCEASAPCRAGAVHVLRALAHHRTFREYRRCAVVMLCLLSGCGRSPQPPTTTPISSPPASLPVTSTPAASAAASALPHPRPTSPADASYARALEAAQQGQLPRALQLLEENTRRYPRHVAFWQLLADVAHDTGQSDRELETCRQLSRLQPRNVENLIRLGNLYLQLEWYQQAEPLFRRALQLAPDDIQAIIGQVSYWYVVNTPRKSVDLLRRAITRYPTNDQLYHALAENYRRLGDFAHAEDAARQGLRINPGNARLYKELAQVLISSQNVKRLPEAEQALRRTLQVQPDDFDSLYLLATVVEDQGRAAEAQQLYESVARVPSETNPALYRLGRLYLKQGRRADGQALIARYEQATHRRDAADDIRKRLWKGGTAADHLAMARYYQQQGDLSRARIEAQRALELDPREAEARRLLQALRTQRKTGH